MFLAFDQPRHPETDLGQNCHAGGRGFETGAPVSFGMRRHAALGECVGDRRRSGLTIWRAGLSAPSAASSSEAAIEFFELFGCTADDRGPVAEDD